MFVVWKVKKGSKKWLPSLVGYDPSWPIQNNEINKYQWVFREVDFEENKQGQRDISFKMDNIDVVNVCVGNKRVELSAV